MLKHCQKYKQSCFNFGFFITFTCLILFLGYKTATSKEVYNQNSCEKVNGNYRAFGDSCLDNCLPQFSKYQPCFNEIKYGCDCGENNCFYQSKCISKVEFKEIFKEIQKSQEEKAIKRKNKMVEMMNDSAAYSRFIHNIFAGYKDEQTQEIKSQAQMLSEQFANEAKQAVASTQQNKQPPPKEPAKVAVAIEKVAKNEPILPKPKIPQFYIDQQANLEKKSREATIPNEELEMIFPVIPLPGAP